MPNALLQQLLIRPRCRLEKAVNLSENNLPPFLFARSQENISQHCT